VAQAGAAMLIDTSVRFVYVMFRRLDVFLAYSTIAIMSFAMNVSFHGNDQNIAIVNRKVVRYARSVRHSLRRANIGMIIRTTNIVLSKNIKII